MCTWLCERVLGKHCFIAKEHLRFFLNGVMERIVEGDEQQVVNQL